MAPPEAERIAAIGLTTSAVWTCLWASSPAEWWFALHKKQGIPLPGKCSALGVFRQPGLPSLLAQNMDLPSFFDGYQTLLRVKPRGRALESYVLTTPVLTAHSG